MFFSRYSFLFIGFSLLISFSFSHNKSLHLCLIISSLIVVLTLVWLPVFGIFNVRPYVDAIDYALGLYRHCKRD